VQDITDKTEQREIATAEHNIDYVLLPKNALPIPSYAGKIVHMDIFSTDIPYVCRQIGNRIKGNRGRKVTNIKYSQLLSKRKNHLL